MVDEEGHKTAVVIDLKEHGELWENIYDALISESRAQDPKESLEGVKQHLVEQGKLSE